MTAVTRARNASRLGLRRIRELIGDNPALLPVVLAFTPEGQSRAVTSRTTIAVEGFPRCGNTFAAAALQLCGWPGMSIASRVHVPAQVKRAVKLGVPTVLVIREPVDAVASLVLAAPHVTLRHGLSEFAHHYEELLPYRGDVLIAPFDLVTSDFGVVVDALNRSYGMGLRQFVHGPETERAVFELMDQRNDAAHKGDIRRRYDTRPSRERTAQKQSLTDLLRAPGLAPLLARATRVYAQYLDCAVRPAK